MGGDAVRGRTDAQPLVPGLPEAWSWASPWSANRWRSGSPTDEDYRVVRRRRRSDRPASCTGTRSPAGVGAEWPAGAGGLSSDGVAVVHPPQRRTATSSTTPLRVLDVASGETVGRPRRRRQRAGPGRDGHRPGRPPPVVSELGGVRAARRCGTSRPATPHPISIAELPGAVFPVALVSRRRTRCCSGTNMRDARSSCALDLGRRGARTGGRPGRRRSTSAAVRPDGEVWFRHERRRTAHRDRRRRRVASVVSNPDDADPADGPPIAVWFDNPHGNAIQAFLSTPDGDGPFPTVDVGARRARMARARRFDPETQAFIDAGYAVAAGELPGFDRVRHRRSGERSDRRHRVCLSPRTSSRAWTDVIADGIVDPDSRLLERMVLGRLPRVPQRRSAPRSVARACSRASRWAIRRRALGERARAPGVGRRGDGGSPDGGAGDVPRARTP